jgi:hypothetical protein
MSVQLAGTEKDLAAKVNELNYSTSEPNSVRGSMAV